MLLRNIIQTRHIIGQRTLLLNQSKMSFSIDANSSEKQFEDPYFLLGITRSEKLKEVKKAYFHKAKKFHPDLNPGDELAKAMFLKI